MKIIASTTLATSILAALAANSVPDAPANAHDSVTTITKANVAHNDEQLVLYKFTECVAAAQTVEGREFAAALPELDKFIAEDIENNLISLLGDILITSLCANCAKPAAQKRIAELHSDLFDEWNQTVTS